MEIRAARPGDRRAIVRFLKGEDKEDYVIDWMDRFQSSGRFFLLLDGSRIAGIVHGKVAPDGSAWMSAARVNEAYRGQGWINRMNAYAVGCVPLRHAHAARMLITNENTSSKRAAAKGGFTPVMAMSFMEWEPKGRMAPAPAGQSGWRGATPAEFRRAARGSKLLAAQRGLAYMSFNGAFEITPESAQRARPWLFVSPENGPLMAAMFPDTGERWMAVQVFRGGRRTARALKAFAREQGADSMTVILPALATARRPFGAEGYTASAWARRVLIFEKRLRRRRGPTSSAVAAKRSTRR